MHYYKKKTNFRNFWSYSRTLLKNSEVTGIVPIIKSKGVCRRLLKTLILLINVIGFVYQTMQYLRIYWQYETTVSEENLIQMMKPAFTICDSNLLNRYDYCAALPQFCFNYSSYDDDKFCKNFPLLCSDGYPYYPSYKMVPNTDYWPPDAVFNLNFTKACGSKIFERIDDCYWSIPSSENKSITKIHCGAPKFNRGVNRLKEPAACWTYGSLINQKNATVEYLKEDSSLLISLYWMNDETLDAWYHVQQSLFLSFHDPREVNNPFDGEIKLYENSFYKVDVREVQTELLPPPYSTACEDYITDWTAKGGSLPRSKKVCKEECKIKAYLKKNNCVSREITYPHEEKLCLQIEPLDFDMNRELRKCDEKCKDSCMDISFQVKEELMSSKQGLHRFHNH